MSVQSFNGFPFPWSKFLTPLDHSDLSPAASLFSPLCSDYTSQRHLICHSCLAHKCLGAFGFASFPFLEYVLSPLHGWILLFRILFKRHVLRQAFLVTQSEIVHDTWPHLSPNSNDRYCHQVLCLKLYFKTYTR